MKFITIIILTLLSTVTFSQTLSTEIDSIYNFKPARLSDKEQESKLPALGKFWEKVKSDTAKYLTQLRFELMQAGHKPFFYYDGSSLLLSLSQARSDKALAALAIAKCDLDDISRRIYVAALNSLAQDGIDVTPAAVKILNDDKFSFFIPQHAMTFNQDYSLAYMLLPQKTNGYVNTLISMFPRMSTTAKKSIVSTLWFAYSCKGDEFLKSILANKAVDKEVRSYVKKIMGYTKLTREQKDYLKMVGKEHLDEIRVASLQRFSDEAITELDMTTRVLRSERTCH
jgi:hypothetical protein